MIGIINEGFDEKHTRDVYSENAETIKSIRNLCAGIKINGLDKISSDLKNFNYDPDTTDFEEMYNKLKEASRIIASLKVSEE